MLAGQQEVNFEGSMEAPLLFVGESPGYEELQRGRPFIGRSGRLLKRAIEYEGIPINFCFFANSARCMLQKDSLTQKEMRDILKACKPKLEAIISHLQPKVIVALGAVALQQVIGMKGIKKARGNFYWSDKYNCWVLPNWHPAYVLRNTLEEDNFNRVFKTLKRFIDNGFRVIDDHEFTYMEVDSIRPLLDGGFQRSADDSCFITAIDTETQGVEWFKGDYYSPTLSYSVAASDTEGWNVALLEECEEGEEPDQYMDVLRGETKKTRGYLRIGLKKAPHYDRKIEELRELLSRQDIQKYFMNIKYEFHRFEQLGIDVTDPEQLANCPIDVALLAHTFDAPKYMNANLGYLLECFCDITSGYKEEWTEAEVSDMLAQMKVDRDKFNRRACFDAIATLKIALQQIKELHVDRQTLNYYVNFAHPVETGILYELERNGVHIDMDALPKVSEEITANMEGKVADFQLLCPRPVVNKHYDNFKLTRRNILMDVLFEYENQNHEVVNLGFGITPIELSPKTKLPKVSKDILKILLDEDIPEKAKELIQIYQDWGDYHTLKSRYISQIEDNLAADEKLYPTYSLTYTSSGRTGARRPSVQNFPKRSASAKLIRRLIKARTGWKLIETDHSMSELRWTAIVANERKMKEIFLKDGDIHLFTGANIAGHRVDIATKAEMIRQLQEVFGVNGDGVKEMRQNAKAVNFGLIYLMSAFGLRNYAYQGFGVKLSEEEASDWRHHFFDLYPDIETWHSREIRKMEEQGSITTIFGRRIPVPNIYSYEKAAQREAQRFGINAEIQGPSSDYALMGGNKCLRSNDYSREECPVRLFIHDSFVWEVREDLEEKYVDLLRHNLVDIDTSKFNFIPSVPFVANAEVGEHLADMEEV